MAILPEVAEVVEELVKAVEDRSSIDEPELATNVVVGPTIIDIPPDVLKGCIQPHLDMKDLGSLSMVSTAFKDTFDDNEIWKIEYMKTIRCVITDKSKHVYIYRRRCLDKDMHPDAFLRCQHVNCLPEEVRDKVPSWASVKEPHELSVFGTHIRRVNYTTYVHEIPYAGPEEKRYEKIIKDIWVKHNRERGLNTVNLCQCQKHYSFNTLDMPKSCRNFKSYKRMLLKKNYTIIKKDFYNIRYAEGSAQRSLNYSLDQIKRIEALKKQIPGLERELEEAKKKSAKYNNLRNSLKVAVDTL